MFSFFNNKVFPIGVDLGSEYLKMVQLAPEGKNLSVIAAAKEDRPAEIEPGTSQWQHWAIKVVKQMTSKGNFKGRKVVTALPVDEVFIDQVKIPAVSSEKLRATVLEKVQPRFGFDPANALVQFVASGEGAEQDVLVMATERTKVDRHLAIYEQAGLEVESVAVWPLALISVYSKFFGRRQSDFDSHVMLLEIGANFSKAVICRHNQLLFARLIPIGIRQMQSQEITARLVFEVSACARFFNSVTQARLDRLIFLTSQATDRALCDIVVNLAKTLQVQAMIGDVLAAVNIAGQEKSKAVERRGCTVNWTASFGLSLNSEGK